MPVEHIPQILAKHLSHKSACTSSEESRVIPRLESGKGVAFPWSPTSVKQNAMQNYDRASSEAFKWGRISPSENLLPIESFLANFSEPIGCHGLRAFHAWHYHRAFTSFTGANKKIPSIGSFIASFRPVPGSVLWNRSRNAVTIADARLLRKLPGREGIASSRAIHSYLSPAFA